MNKYELTLVLDGKTTAAKAKAETQKVGKIIELFKGKVGKVSDWGKINALYYLLLELELDSASAHKLNDKLRMEDGLKRYLLVRI